MADDDNVAENAVENAREELGEFFFRTTRSEAHPHGNPTFFFLFSFFFEALAHTLFLRQSSVRTGKKASLVLNREKHEVLNIFQAIVGTETIPVECHISLRKDYKQSERNVDGSSGEGVRPFI